MKTKFLSIIILSVLSLNGIAQEIGQKTIIQRNEKGVIQSVEYAIDDKTVAIPKSANDSYRSTARHSDTCRRNQPSGGRRTRP